MDYQKLQPINELYTCIQGEGRDTGKPMILIRMSGCRLRCQFSDTSFCDTVYSSWKPEKGKFSLEEVIKIYKNNPQITHTLITGGGPTLNPDLLKELCRVARLHDHYICIETEGSEYVETVADFISLSPKLSSSAPRVGTVKPWDNTKVTQEDNERHEKWRTNYYDMKQLIEFHPDYQFKPVICSEEDLIEVEELIEKLHITPDKVWAMPEGQTESDLSKNRQWLVTECIKRGWNYTDRQHITIWGPKRGV